MTLFNWNKVSNQIEVIHFCSDQNFDYCLAKLEMEGQVFCWTGLTGQRGPPLKVNHFDRKIPTKTKAFHLFLNENVWKFWFNGKHSENAKKSLI